MKLFWNLEIGGEYINIINNYEDALNPQCRLGVRKPDNSEMTSVDLSYINSTYITKLEATLKTKEKSFEETTSYREFKDVRYNVIGFGPKEYFGKKIDLNIEQKRACSYGILKEWEYNPNYNYEAVQSATYYGNYIFMPLHAFDGGNGDLLIFDFTTLNVVDRISFGETTSEAHGNNIQFTNIFYQNGDEFPLCIISYWGINPDDNKAGFARVVRIQRNGNSFTGEIISTITTKENKPYLTWGFDLFNNTLYAMGFSNDNTSISSRYHTVFYKWIMPQNLTNDNVLSLSDAVKSELNFTYIQQGFFAKNGKLYLYTTEEMGVPYNIQVGVWVVDEASFNIETIIPIKRKTYEPEGIFEKDGNIYLVDRVAKGSSGNVLRLIKLGF